MRPGNDSPNGKPLWERPATRREVLKGLGIAGAGLLFGCAPAKIVLGLYSDDFDRDRALSDRYLEAFVETVVPGSSSRNGDRIRVFYDDYYPFAAHRSYFLDDLRGRSRRLTGRDFPEVEEAARVAVIQGGLRAGAVTRRLYTGAVFLTQIAVYAGIYDAERGCKLIDFDGSNLGFPASTLSYPDPSRFLAVEQTATGNFA